MAKLIEPEVLACYKNALQNWRYNGYVVFLKDAQRGRQLHLSSHTELELKELLYRFVVMEDGEVDAVVEERENWRDAWSHHYDLRPMVDGVKYYFETRLKYSKPDDPDDPVIFVVNLKPA